MKINKKYKDTVFRHLFNINKIWLLKLVNAILGTNYNDHEAIITVSLEDVLFMNMKNDLCIIVDDTIILIEHQSTINENMPVRMFLYLARIYEKITNKDSKDLYGRRLVELPNPELIVLYNGREDYPAEKILKLSASFKKGKGKKKTVDLEVKALNINKGVNPELEHKCKALADYTSFIAKVREYENYCPVKEQDSFEEAIKSAIEYCINNDILKEYLTDYASEVINMLTAEFKLEDALEVARWEGREEGIEEGKAEGEKKVNYMLKLMKQGLSYEEIKKKVEKKSKK